MSIYTNRIESDFVPPHGVLKLIKGIITLKTSDQPQILLHQVPTNQSSPQINRYLIVLNELIEFYVLKGLKPNGYKYASISRYKLVSTKLSRDRQYLRT